MWEISQNSLEEGIPSFNSDKFITCTGKRVCIPVLLSILSLYANACMPVTMDEHQAEIPAQETQSIRHLITPPTHARPGATHGYTETPTIIQILPPIATDISIPIPADLSEFVNSVIDGQSDVLKGVYVQDVLAMPVVQQPIGYPGYVSDTDGQITQFNMASEVGNVGLLAHNYLGGALFSEIEQGMKVSLVYGDGNLENFVVTRILKYQALDSLSPYSDFRDLESGITYSAEETFNTIYGGNRHVTFQTCIENRDNISWGRLFVIAEPEKGDADDSQPNIK